MHTFIHYEAVLQLKIFNKKILTFNKNLLFTFESSIERLRTPEATVSIDTSDELASLTLHRKIFIKNFGIFNHSNGNYCYTCIR